MFARTLNSCRIVKPGSVASAIASSSMSGLPKRPATTGRDRAPGSRSAGTAAYDVDVVLHRAPGDDIDRTVAVEIGERRTRPAIAVLGWIRRASPPTAQLVALEDARGRHDP